MSELALLLCPMGAVHLCALAHAGLVEHRQEDNPPSWGEPVGDALLIAVQGEAQLAELAAQMSGLRLAEGLRVISQVVGRFITRR